MDPDWAGVEWGTLSPLSAGMKALLLEQAKLEGALPGAFIDMEIQMRSTDAAVDLPTGYSFDGGFVMRRRIYGVVGADGELSRSGERIVMVKETFSRVDPGPPIG